MKLKLIRDNILYLTFPTQKELTLTLCRPQEFYECNDSRFRGTVFTFEQFIDHYLDDLGYLTYFSYWSGFNLPSNILEEFFYKFKLSDREQLLRDITKPFKSKPYYLIATKKGDKDTLDHELVHAHYYLNAVYRQEVNVLVRHMRPELKKQLSKKLKELGYNSTVLIDEINAYMSTSSAKYLSESLELEITKRDVKPFENLAKLVLRD